MFAKLINVAKHLSNGTLGSRLREKKAEKEKLLRPAIWKKSVESNMPFIVQLRSSVQLRLYPDSELSRLIYLDDFEAAELAFVESYLQAGEMFCDIGANVGLFSVIAARKVGITGRVYAFEPSRQTFARLNENIALNNFKNVTCLPCGVSNEVAELELKSAADGHDAWNSFAAPYVGAGAATEKVHCTTLDEFTKRENLRGKISLLKIDVEGWETNVVMGAGETLSDENAPAILVEFTEEAARSAGTTCQILYKRLQQHGYSMFLYDRQTGKLIEDPMRDWYDWVNLIALKGARRDRYFKYRD